MTTASRRPIPSVPGSMRKFGIIPPAYSSKFSRRDFTQHQLFALAVLKTFLKTDYRGLVEFLNDFRELRDDLGLEKVPHYSTLCKAIQRLLKKGSLFSSWSQPPCAPRTAA